MSGSICSTRSPIALPLKNLPFTLFTKMPVPTLMQTLFRMKLYLASILPSLRLSIPKESQPSEHLTIIDSRTKRQYEIPIHHNAVEAIRFKEIRAPKNHQYPADNTERGLRVFDQGFQNTAVMGSEVTYVDGVEGSIHYRNHSIADLVGKQQFEDVTFLLIWGHLPSTEERERYRRDLAGAMVPPQMVCDVIQSFP